MRFFVQVRKNKVNRLEETIFIEPEWVYQNILDL